MTDKRLVSLEQQADWIKEDRAETPSTKAWRQLLLSLRVSLALFENTSVKPDTEQERDAIIETLLGVLGFLKTHKVANSNKLYIPLLRLLQSFHDIKHGNTSVLFKPIKPGRGGMEKATARSFIMAVAARTLEEMMQVPGTVLGEAARTVAHTIQSSMLPGFEKCGATTVEKWRDRMLAADRGTAKVSKRALDHWRGPLPPEAGTTAKTRAAFLLFYLKKGRNIRWE